MNENTNSSSECAKSLRTAADILKCVGIALICIGIFAFFCTLLTGKGFIIGIGLSAAVTGVISFFIFWVFSLLCSAMAEIVVNTQICAENMKAAATSDANAKRQKMSNELPKM